MVKERFLPLSIAIKRITISGLKWVKGNIDVHYLSLSENLAFKTQLSVTTLKNFSKGILYHYSCPLFKMGSTGDCVQDVVYTSHPLRKCCLTSRCTKIYKQTKMTPHHHQNHIKDCSVLLHDLKESIY